MSVKDKKNLITFTWYDENGKEYTGHLEIDKYDQKLIDGIYYMVNALYRTMRNHSSSKIQCSLKKAYDRYLEPKNTYITGIKVYIPDDIFE